MTAPTVDFAKILVIGPVKGKFKEFVEKMNAINLKNGPFNFILCLGDFFDKDSSKADVAELDDLDVPVKFMMGNDPLPTWADEELKKNAGSLNDKVSYLGSCGNLTTVEGVRMAYVGGHFDAEAYLEELDDEAMDNMWSNQYKKAAIKKLCGKTAESSVQAHSEHYGIDILLTNEWPWGAQNGSQKYAQEVAQNKMPASLKSGERGSNKAFANLAKAIQPRYHFSASMNTFFEREPYKNDIEYELKPSMAFKAKHCTRFLNLAPFLKENDRWYYAMNLTPLKKAKDEDINHIPANATNCPYIEHETAPKKRANSDADNRPTGKKCRKEVPANYTCHKCKQVSDHWIVDCPEAKTAGTRKPPPETYTCHACGQKGHWIQNCEVRKELEEKRSKLRIGAKNDTCWFCPPDFTDTDASERFASHLLLYCSDQAYVSLAKGPLVENHLLVVPLNHFPSSLYLQELQSEESAAITENMTLITSKLIDWLHKSNDSDAVVFEAFGGESSKHFQHVCMHVLPIAGSKSAELAEKFISDAPKYGWKQAETLAKDYKDAYFKVTMYPRDGEAKTLNFVPLSAAELQNNENISSEKVNGGAHKKRPSQPSIQVGRFILCDFLDLPDKKDWHACCLSKEEEITQADKLKPVIQTLF